MLMSALGILASMSPQGLGDLTKAQEDCEEQKVGADEDKGDSEELHGCYSFGSLTSGLGIGWNWVARLWWLPFQSWAHRH